jgi:hypothetical protein
MLVMYYFAYLQRSLWFRSHVQKKVVRHIKLLKAMREYSEDIANSKCDGETPFAEEMIDMLELADADQAEVKKEVTTCIDTQKAPSTVPLGMVEDFKASLEAVISKGMQYMTSRGWCNLEGQFVLRGHTVPRKRALIIAFCRGANRN